jgi:hypothetical protein
MVLAVNISSAGEATKFSRSKGSCLLRLLLGLKIASSFIDAGPSNPPLRGDEFREICNGAGRNEGSLIP